MALLREAEYSAQIIERIANRQAPRLAKAFVLAVRGIQEALPLKRLEVLMQQGKFEEALEFLRELGPKMATATGSAIDDAARQAQTWLNTGAILDVVVSFDRSNFRASQAFDDMGLQKVKQFNDEQLAATRQAIARGIQSGINPRDMARDFRQSIGLTRRQEAAVDNFRKLLETGSKEATTRRLMNGRDIKTFENALKAGRELTASQIDKMVERYRVNYVAYRAEVIGRTEALRAANEGSQLMFKQAIEQGGLQSNEIVRSWVTGKDERVRPSHAAMQGQLRDLDTPFLSGDGFQLMYPGDPNAPEKETILCRCAVTMRLVPGGVSAFELELATRKSAFGSFAGSRQARHVACSAPSCRH